MTGRTTPVEWRPMLGCFVNEIVLEGVCAQLHPTVKAEQEGVEVRPRQLFVRLR